MNTAKKFFIIFTTLILCTMIILGHSGASEVNGTENTGITGDNNQANISINNSENRSQAENIPLIPQSNTTASVEELNPPDSTKESAAENRVINKPDTTQKMKAFAGWLEMAQNASAAQNYQAASEAYAAALRIDRDSQEAQIGYALTLAELDRSQEALPILQSIWNKSPEKTELYLPLGRELNRNHQYNFAREILTNATLHFPDSPVVWQELASSYAGLSRYEEALTHVRKSLEKDQNHPGGWGQLGVILSGQGRFFEAVAAYEKALTLDPQQTKFFEGLGDTWMALSKYKEAAAAYETAHTIRPLDAPLAMKLAQAYDNHGKVLKAAKIRESLIFNQLKEEPTVSPGASEGSGLKQETEPENFRNETP